jgi:hypothetical protein
MTGLRPQEVVILPERSYEAQMWAQTLIVIKTLNSQFL